MNALASIKDYNGEENHYLLIWDDPMSMEIRNEKQLRWMLEECANDDDCTWSLCEGIRSYGDEPSTENIGEVMDHLNKEKDITIGEMRDPSPQSITDEAGYVRIRRIYNKGE